MHSWSFPPAWQRPNFFALAFIFNASCHTQAAESPPQNPDGARPTRNAASQPKLATSATPPVRCFWDDGKPPRTAAEAAAHVERLADVTDMPAQCVSLCAGGHECGDAAFWRVVRDGLVAVPFLIASLDDTTPTSAKVHYLGGVHTKGDVALTALEEMVADFLVMELLGMKNADCPACAWWDFVRGPPGNRKLVKRRVAKWFDQHASRLVWKNEDFMLTGDCADDCTHPAGGHYHVK